MYSWVEARQLRAERKAGNFTPQNTAYATEKTAEVDCATGCDGLSVSLTFMTANSKNLLETADMRT